MKPHDDTPGKTTVMAIALVALVMGVAAIAFFSLIAFYVTAAAITVAAYAGAYIARRHHAPGHRETRRQSPAG